LETGSAALELIAQMCANPLQDGRSKNSLRVLVADDDPISCRAMSNALQLKFGKPDCAESGEVAVALAAQRTYDVIFMDVRMPGMDGFMACSLIRKTLANRSTPIVLVTGLSDTESQSRCSLSGGNAFISKPVFPAQIALAATAFSMRGKLALSGQTEYWTGAALGSGSSLAPAARDIKAPTPGPPT
jgi:two-component system sensor histidine kinase BarA